MAGFASTLFNGLIGRGRAPAPADTTVAEQLAASHGYPLVQISLKGTAGHVEIRTAAAA